MINNRSYNVALIHPFDPRGSKVGGVETFVRDYITYHPKDMNLLLIGVDGFSDLPIGVVHKIEYRGRELSFLPVMRVPEEETNQYASGLFHALTLRFFFSVLRYYFSVKKELRRGQYSIDLRRMEISPLAWIFKRPLLQMLHDGMTKDKPMSSLLRKFWWVKEFSERFSVGYASRFYCVNDELTERLKRAYPKHRSKLGTLPTWANPNIFVPTPFPKSEQEIHIGFTGRMDTFKRPDLMFRLVAILRSKHPSVRFHYVGDGDVEQFKEFDEIRDIAILHGKVRAEELAEIVSTLHMGILTSDFEGMPRSVMEFLASGRPVVSLHLPQLEAVIHEGQSGYLVQRDSTMLNAMADRVIDMYASIEAGRVTPQEVAASVADYHPQRLLGQLYSDHRRMQGLPS